MGAHLYFPQQSAVTSSCHPIIVPYGRDRGGRSIETYQDALFAGTANAPSCRTQKPCSDSATRRLPFPAAELPWLVATRFTLAFVYELVEVCSPEHDPAAKLVVNQGALGN